MTEIDVASQRAIESIIMGTFPKHGFLGEESVEAGHCASVGMSNFRYAFCMIWIDYLIIIYASKETNARLMILADMGAIFNIN